MNVTLYDAQTIDRLKWPKSKEADFAKRLLLPLIKEGVENYIDNVRTKLFALHLDDLVLPVTVNDMTQDNSYVCSPYSYFALSGKKRATNIKNSLLREMAHLGFKGLDFCLRLGDIDRTIAVNNWLLPTNLYPALSFKQLQAITEKLLFCYPNHAILFRSVNPQEQISSHLKTLSYDLMAYRQVFFQQEASFRSRMFRSDLKVLKQSPYNILDSKQITKEQIPRLLTLYRSLYFQKHAATSPNFTPEFLKLAIDKRLFDFQALEKEGRIDAVVGWFECNGTMTSPFFGYDTSLPQQLGLYRQISTLIALKAKEKNIKLNQSAGAGSFKELRRAVPSIEHLAIYCQHLPRRQRMLWKGLAHTMNRFGIKWIKKI